MIVNRTVTIVLMAVLGPGLSACSTPRFEDFCRYSDERSVREADPQSLALVLGVTPGLARETPLVVVRSLSEHNRGAAVSLHAVAAPHPMPASLDESRCAAVDWNTYTLTVDEDEWSAFWSETGHSPFEIAIAFLETNESLLVSKFGAAIVDTAASDYLVSCGCYWK
ncbi:MAG: hypothetical protein GWM87_00940 [Xanthomonadales bacterium]|nr:hypothetical protein [Xanthomonadales bacterium]NIX11659.1 hypothetical protein [Xanthomonadales bacterium]